MKLYDIRFICFIVCLFASGYTVKEFRRTIRDNYEDGIVVNGILLVFFAFITICMFVSLLLDRVM